MFMPSPPTIDTSTARFELRFVWGQRREHPLSTPAGPRRVRRTVRGGEALPSGGRFPGGSHERWH